MKKIITSICLVIVMVFGGAAFAADVKPTPITAEAAFHAVQTQTYPGTRVPASVALIDVRSRAEYFWVGAACQVDEIIPKRGPSHIPLNGWAMLVSKPMGRGVSKQFLRFRSNRGFTELPVESISEVKLSPIGINIPYKFWNERNGTLRLNKRFGRQIEDLAGEFDVLIFFCRSGGRSEDSLGEFDTTLFEALYEIDQPSGTNGRGGFEGTSYSNVFNGDRGYPGRNTLGQTDRSVSWKDAGLPIKTSINPVPPRYDHDDDDDEDDGRHKRRRKGKRDD